jgi:hypothetical protein
VHGAGAAQALLRAGQLDELELHVVPVPLGQGWRLFDNLPAEHIELSLVHRLATLFPAAGDGRQSRADPAGLRALGRPRCGTRLPRLPRPAR